VRLDDRLRDVQPEPGSLDLPLKRALRPEEALEEKLALAGSDPDARVGDLDPDEPIGARRRESTRPPAGVNLSAFEIRLSSS